MTPAIITAYDICEYFQKGDIAILPDDHIKFRLHKFFTRLQRGLSDEETKQKRIDCINKYINNHDLMAERYINIIKNNEIMQHILNSLSQNKIKNSSRTNNKYIGERDI
jgi:hypothetical protein